MKRPRSLSCQDVNFHFHLDQTIRRHIHIEGLALAPLVFGGLFISLWTWKCFMLVIFQNKIIFMPGLPPNSRWERIEDYSARLCGVEWREEQVRSADGTHVALCVADVDLGAPRRQVGGVGGSGETKKRVKWGEKGEMDVKDKMFYVLYFQGNAASIPPRLPDISSTLSLLKRQLSAQAPGSAARCTFVCLSYRGYWTSKGRPTEAGIRLDALAALEWIARRQRETFGGNINSGGEEDMTNPSAPAEVILWGQSIGCGVATNLAADVTSSTVRDMRINSMILETPFTSLKAMLEVLYPQRWLPYKYLWPFLRNHLDSWRNLGIVADNSNSNYGYNCPQNELQASKSDEKKVKGLGGNGNEKTANQKTKLPEILILQAVKDELVPAELSQMIYDRCRDLYFPVTRVAVDGAFHNDTMFRSEGKRAVAEFLARKMREE